MKRTHILLTWLVPAIFLAFPSALWAQTGPADDGIYGEHIRSFDTQVVVAADASARVTEDIVYDFADQYKHGIYRDIPVDYRASDGSSWSFRLSDIAVSDENGAPYTFSLSHTGPDERIKIGDPDNTVTGIHEYVISYTVDRPIGYFKDFDEIYWNATGNEWLVPIARASATVTLPQAVAQSPLKTSCYFGPAGSTDRCDDSLAVNGNQISFSAPGQLDAGSGLTVAVGFPKGIVSVPTAAQAMRYAISDFISGGLWLFALPVIVFVALFCFWRARRRSLRGSGIIIARYEAPDGLSPMQTRYILKQSFGPSLSAEIIYLAVRGYLKISRIAGDYEISKLKEADVDLSASDRLLFEGLFAPVAPLALGRNPQSVVNPLQIISQLGSKGIFGGGIRALARDIAEQSAPQPVSQSATPAQGSAVRLSSLRNAFYTTAQSVATTAQTSLIESGYFDQKVKAGDGLVMNGTSRFTNIAILGFCVLFFGVSLGSPTISYVLSDEAGTAFAIAFVLSVVIAVVFLAIMPRRMTPKGAAAREAVQGLKLYLSVAEKDRIAFHDAPEKSQGVFEKFLPYAIALGVEKQWVKVFEGITLAPPTWYSDPTMSAFNAGIFATHMSAFSSASGSSLTSSPSAAPGSSSGSGGGGFSGGGGGGGGGGSW